MSVLHSQNRGFTPENAEALAIEAFTFLSQDEDRLNDFLSASGIELGDLQNASREPYFLEAVMDHLTSADDLVLAFAASSSRPPEHAAYAAQYFKAAHEAS